MKEKKENRKERKKRKVRGFPNSTCFHRNEFTLHTYSRYSVLMSTGLSFLYRVHHGTGKMDLSLRLSQVDPEAAKKKRRAEQKELQRRSELGSDGEGKLREIHE